MNENKKVKYYTVRGYKITEESEFTCDLYENPPELNNQLEELFFEAQDKNNKRAIDRLKELIIQYPNSPQIKNYLSVAYNIRGKYKKSIEVENRIRVEHPDYLFGKINIAHDYINKGELEKVPELLGESLDIKELYPEREIFHLSEITSFFSLVVMYYVAKDDLEMAEIKLEILNEISPSHNNTISSEKVLMAYRIEKATERWEEEEKTRIMPLIPSGVSAKQTKKPPQLNNPDVNNLYNYGLYIPEEKLKEILSLPRETLIEDLEKIISDAESRYKYFKKMEWQEETHIFLLHSFFILNEINAVESLPRILSFLENDTDFIEFWIGDHITETLWFCFYGLGLNQLALLKQFLLKPGVDTFVKSSITSALSQMVLHHAEKRNEILNVFSEVFTGFFQASLNDNLVDSEFLGLTVGDAIDCGLIELLPLIKQLYDKGYVSNSVCGGYNDVEIEFKWPKKNVIKKIYSIAELYRDVTSTWSGYLKEKDDGNDSSDVFEIPAVQEYVKRTVPKIGRNDPCPCGSGKKYKKCHGAN